MRKQDWAQLASVIGVVAAIASFLRRRVGRGFLFVGVAVASDAVGRAWSRRNPTPLPFSLRGVLAVPRPAAVLRSTLDPRHGERILEIGPGLGQEAVHVATAVGTAGRVDVLDVQPEMLEATSRRAQRHGVTNIVASVADASARLPYDDAAFDAVYLMGVLGEIPKRDEMLVELRRVLKPDGRLIVGEVAADPDFVPLRRLRPMAEAAGFTLERRDGPPFAFQARFIVHEHSNARAQ